MTVLADLKCQCQCQSQCHQYLLVAEPVPMPEQTQSRFPLFPYGVRWTKDLPGRELSFACMSHGTCIMLISTHMHMQTQVLAPMHGTSANIRLTCSSAQTSNTQTCLLGTTRVQLCTEANICMALLLCSSSSTCAHAYSVIRSTTPTCTA